MSTNDITGDRIASKSSKLYTDNFDSIFRKPINLLNYPRHEATPDEFADAKIENEEVRKD